MQIDTSITRNFHNIRRYPLFTCDSRCITSIELMEQIRHSPFRSFSKVNGCFLNLRKFTRLSMILVIFTNDIDSVTLSKRATTHPFDPSDSNGRYTRGVTFPSRNFPDVVRGPRSRGRLVVRFLAEALGVQVCAPTAGPHSEFFLILSSGSFTGGPTRRGAGSGHETPNSCFLFSPFPRCLTKGTGSLAFSNSNGPGNISIIVMEISNGRPRTGRDEFHDEQRRFFSRTPAGNYPW